MSVQDSYVGRPKGPAFGGSNDKSLTKALAAKAHAVRRLERQGRRTKIAARNLKNTWAA
jgi:hypothetical protein